MTRRLVLVSLASQVAAGVRAFSQSSSRARAEAAAWNILLQVVENGDVEHRKKAITALDHRPRSRCATDGEESASTRWILRSGRPPPRPWVKWVPGKPLLV